MGWTKFCDRLAYIFIVITWLWTYFTFFRYLLINGSWNSVLNVLVGSVHIQGPREQYVKAGTTWTLTCEVTGLPAIRSPPRPESLHAKPTRLVDWLHEGKLLTYQVRLWVADPWSVWGNLESDKPKNLETDSLSWLCAHLIVTRRPLTKNVCTVYTTLKELSSTVSLLTHILPVILIHMKVMTGPVSGSLLTSGTTFVSLYVFLCYC